MCSIQEQRITETASEDIDSASRNAIIPSSSSCSTLTAEVVADSEAYGRDVEAECASTSSKPTTSADTVNNGLDTLSTNKAASDQTDTTEYAAIVADLQPPNSVDPAMYAHKKLLSTDIPCA